MKFPNANPALALLALTGVAAADLPKKAPLSRYQSLYTNSPFTSKPPPAESGPESNPLDDYALIGVSSIGGTGYRVTLINKKKPDERITVDSDNAKSGFKILGVTRKSGDPLGTVVKMSSGSMEGTVSFDQKLLTLVAAAPKPVVQQPGQPPQPGQVQPGQPVQPGGPQRQPRPRVVPPPTPQVGGQVPPQNQGIPQPVQQIQQNNPNQQRPSRR